MTKIVAIHQPNFAPWLGYFHKMRRADVFVLLDDAEFSKNSYTNRVRIQADRWLTVPVRAHLGTPISEVKTAEPDLAERHRGILRATYGRLSSIDDFVSIEREALAASDLLVDLNLAVLGYLRAHLGIGTELVRSSDLDANGTSTQRLVSIVTQLKGDTYLSGTGGGNYQDESMFRDAGIGVEYSRFEPKGRGTGASYSALHALLTRRDEDWVAGSW